MKRAPRTAIQLQSAISSKKADARILLEGWHHFRAESATLFRWTLASCFTLNAGGIVGALGVAKGPDVQPISLFLIGLMAALWSVVRMADQMGKAARGYRDLHKATMAHIDTMEQLDRDLVDEIDDTILHSVLQKRIDEGSRISIDRSLSLEDGFDKLTSSIVMISLIAFFGGIVFWVL